MAWWRAGLGLRGRSGKVGRRGFVESWSQEKGSEWCIKRRITRKCRKSDLVQANASSSHGSATGIGGADSCAARIGAGPAIGEDRMQSIRMAAIRSKAANQAA